MSDRRTAFDAITKDKPKGCGSCKWHEDFNGVCFNGDSERRADYTDSDESCGEWEGKS